MPIDPNAVQWDAPAAPALDPNAVQWDDASTSAKPPTKPRTLTEELTRQLGLTARAGATGLTGASSMVLDALTGLNNMGRTGARALGLTTTPNAPLPSQGIQQAMTTAGVPNPEGMGENITQALATMVAGAGDPASKFMQTATNTKWAAPAKPPVGDVKASTLKEAVQEGYVIPPSQAEAGFGMRTLEGMGGSARTIEMAKAKNQMVTDSLARRALGLPEGTELTPETLSNLTKSAYQTGYLPLANAGKITTGRVYRQELGKIVDDLQGQARSFPDAAKPEVLDLVKSYAVKEFDAGDAIKAASALRTDARTAFKQGNNALGIASRRIADALEKNIELNLKARGEPAEILLENFKNARTLMSKAHIVEDSLIEGAGSVNALKIAAALRNDAPLTGELALIAKTANTFGRSVAYPTGGKPSPINVGDSMFIGAGGFGSSVMPGLGSLAAVPFARYGAREAALSSPMQKAFVQGTGMAPGPGMLGNPAFQRAIPSAYPLFNPTE